MTSNNIEMLKIIAAALGELNEEVVYVGGSVVELYADHPASEEIRPTEDIDIVMQAATTSEFNRFEKIVRAKGFCNDMTEKAPICRWVYNGIKVDFMPSSPDIVGFGNRWYSYGCEQKEQRILDEHLRIYVFPVCIFLASKLEAVEGRGKSDLRLSHDFEDIVYIFDNCETLPQAFLSSSEDLRSFLKTKFDELQLMSIFKEAVACALPFNSDPKRIQAVMEKIYSLVRSD